MTRARSGATFLERRKDLAVADRLLRDAGDGAALLLLEGEPGIGKTALVREVTARAADLGMTVLACRPSQAEVRRPHAALVELLDGVDDLDLASLPQAQARAVGVALGRAAPDARPAEWQTVAAGVATLLTELAGRRALLLVVDDVHLLDAASTQALEFGLRRVRDRAVAVLAAARIGEGPAPRPLERAVPPERVTRWILGPLPDRAIVTLLRDRAPAAARHGVRRIAAAARGNPFAALELARAAAAGDEAGDATPLPVPADVREVVARRLARLPEPTREALLQVAACSPSTPCPPEVLADLAPAEAAGTVTIGGDGIVAFTHPLYESAILALSAPEARRRTHLRLADRTADPVIRAHHLALGADGPDAAAAAAIEAAAEAAAARGLPHVAADLAHRAWRLTPAGDTDDAGRRAGRTCEMLARAGRHADILELTGEIPDLGAPHMGRVLVLAAEARYWGGQITEARDFLERAVVHLADDPETAAWAHIWLMFSVHYAATGGADEALAHAERAVALAYAAGPAGPVAEALAARAGARWRVVGGIDEDGLSAAEGYTDPGRPGRAQLRPGLIRAVLRGYAGDLDEAIREIHSEIDRVAVHGHLGDLPFLALHLGSLGALRADHAAVERASVVAEDVAPEIGGAFAPVPLGLVESNVHVLSGDGAAARAAVSPAMRLAETGHPAMGIPWMAATLARLELCLEDPDAALRALGPALRLIDAERIPDPGYAYFVPDAVEALVLTGRTAEAEALLGPYERRCADLDRAWSAAAALRARALLTAARGDREGAAAQAEASVAGLSGTQLPVDLGRSLLVLGIIERRRRRRGAARSALTGAHDVFAAHGVGLWRLRAERELDGTWSPPATAEALSLREERVARLAAEGRSNPEIAEELFISRRTVEATLSRVYRKLGIRNRNALRARLTPRDGE